jgi:hypothetical protein
MAWQLAPPIKCAICHYHSLPCTVSGFRSAITDAPQIGKKPRHAQIVMAMDENAVRAALIWKT